ncbi:hypothetical protein [Clostridium algidicarnis]|uniref:hypothetical protein n=1 Tax=Clostridium algidicarnis TaxID=37659 RepID=UPI001C0D0DC9|nr:hypothetical protein [Clostridium algidicarnis]MBU3228909.1 hypothetical protein [Clostridium algidicarnis]MBU3252453.1 hypothetical protein [Clostridium algidicarnis]
MDKDSIPNKESGKLPSSGKVITVDENKFGLGAISNGNDDNVPIISLCVDIVFCSVGCSCSGGGSATMEIEDDIIL